MKVQHTKGWEFDIAGFSEQGPRSENQDAFSIESFERAHLLVLADGMGGERSGRVAAALAIETLQKEAPFHSIDGLRRGIRDADRALQHRAAEEPSLHTGMGCALGALAFLDAGDGAGWLAAHVGDVRILSRSPDGLLRLETRDHTPAFSRWEAGEISLDQIPDSSGANRLQRAVGRGGEPDLAWLPARAGWSWLMISDGVYKAMRLDELGQAMAAGSAGDACTLIREKVQQRGADDNFTAIHVRIVGHAPHGADRDSQGGMMIGGAHPEGGRAAVRGSASGQRWAALALVVALGAALLAIFALVSARESMRTARGAELDALRLEVETLRAEVGELRDPFGPSAPPLAPGGILPESR